MDTIETISESGPNEASKDEATIQIHYEKNQMYRTIYSDGAIGGITPTNTVFLSFYGTRSIIPKSMIYPVSEDGLLGEGRVSEDSKAGFIREIEVGVYMTKQSAQDLFDFLKGILDDEK